eukprot:4450465-Alexandrium_andersonii.AAC.1
MAIGNRFLFPAARRPFGQKVAARGAPRGLSGGAAAPPDTPGWRLRARRRRFSRRRFSRGSGGAVAPPARPLAPEAPAG